MSAEKRNELREELAGLMDAALKPEEQAALETRIQNEPDVCREWLALLRQDVLLSEVFSDAHYLKAPVPVVRPKTQRTRFWIAASAACLVAAWLVSLSQQKETAQVRPYDTPKLETAVVVRVDGDVRIERNANAIPAQKGAELAAGDSVVLSGNGARVEVRFADNSLISSEQAARWMWAKTDSKRQVDLEHGTVSALIEKQKIGSFVLNTRHARVTVVGTRFTLSANERDSTLDLFEGSVRFQRVADGQEIRVEENHRAVAGADVSRPLAATVLNAPIAGRPRALLVTAEPLPFYAHDVALQRLLMKSGFEVDLKTYNRLAREDLEGKALIVVPSHRCSHDKIIASATAPVMAWHNVWHQELGLMNYDTPVDHQLKLRDASWIQPVPDAFSTLARQSRATFALNVYSSVPSNSATTAVLNLKDAPTRSPLAFFEKDATAGRSGRRVAFSIDVRESGGGGAPVEIGEELFLAALGWCVPEMKKSP